MTEAKAADALVRHLVARLYQDGDLGWLIGPGTEMFTLLTAAVAEQDKYPLDADEADLRRAEDRLLEARERAPHRRLFGLHQVRGVLEDRVTRLEIDDSEEPITPFDPAHLDALDRLDDFLAELALTDEEIDAARAARAADKETAAREAEIARVQVPLFPGPR